MGAGKPAGKPTDLVLGWATHYGESYRGQPLGCAGAGVYDPADTSIAAVGPERYGEWPCGTRLRVCALPPILGRAEVADGLAGDGADSLQPVRCVEVVRVDSCPGCAANVIDLSEAGNAVVCSVPSACRVTIEVLR